MQGLLKVDSLIFWGTRAFRSFLAVEGFLQLAPAFGRDFKVPGLEVGAADGPILGLFGARVVSLAGSLE